jgi:hypothetical protein
LTGSSRIGRIRRITAFSVHEKFESFERFAAVIRPIRSIRSDPVNHERTGSPERPSAGGIVPAHDRAPGLF